jgi:hypothetical protein
MGDFEKIVQTEIEWSKAHPYLGEQQKVYEACLRLLWDLARLRWKIREQGFGIALENPQDKMKGGTEQEIQEYKQAIRLQLEPAIMEYLDQDSVRGFVVKMENKKGREKKSILNLIASGPELHDRLSQAAALKGDERSAALQSAVQPYLQLATGDQVDKFTGHRLGDVWRYFRLSWSLPPSNVPGRQLLYLIRDAAHPFHAVIGIAGLNNCPIEMGESRETYIGWHRKALDQRMEHAAKVGSKALREEFYWLNERIQEALNEVDPTNLVTPMEMERTTVSIINRLLQVSDQLATLREERLTGSSRKTKEKVRVPPVSDDLLLLDAGVSTDESMNEARKYLVGKKRATAIAKLLSARLVLQNNAEQLCSVTSAVEAFRSAEVQSAVISVLESLKSRRAGANLLELTTCGAVPPYSAVLGGKLVSLLMLSPEVGADYRRIYNGPSIISSQISNRELIRDNSLVYLGTTSLFANGSSQYNRLSLPSGVISEDQKKISFERIGLTAGFGTLQFSAETTKAISELLQIRQSYKEVNSVFGEGASPKMRKIRAGLRELGFDPAKISQHRQQRIIYGCALFPEARDWLLERSSQLPKYITKPEKFRSATSRIAEFWRCRWLASRLDHLPALERLNEQSEWAIGDRLPIR